MSIGSKKRPRLSRVAPLDLPPNRLERALMVLQRGDVLLRLALCAVAAVAIWFISGGWAPPFTYREGFRPPRDVTARTKFEIPDPVQTERDREKAEEQEPFAYKHEPKELNLRRADLEFLLKEILNTEELKELKPDVWKQFMSPRPEPNETVDLEKEADQYRQFRTALVALGGEEKVKAAVDRVFAPLEQRGILKELPEEHVSRNREHIYVYTVGHVKDAAKVFLTDVLFNNGERVNGLIRDNFGNSIASERLSAWLLPQLPNTLTIDVEESHRRQQIARNSIEERTKPFDPGAVLAPFDKPITPESMVLLRAEHERFVSGLTLARRLERTGALFGMIAALYVLCGYYVYFRERRLIADLGQFVLMLSLMVAVVAAVRWATPDPWRAELIPLLLFAMTFGIAYHRDVALVLTMSAAGVVAVTGGEGLGEFVVLTGTAVTAVLQTSQIRSRSKLIGVGLVSAVTAFLLTVGMSIFDEQPLDATVLINAGRNALWTLLTGFLMTGMLPYVERLFGVLTDISLLELGDATHPLLQELVRRAPGTYNHSINVASLAEAAADTIGARGLLVRVGAYFHDIGKMLKPDYFVENQGLQSSRHENLLPAMSTLIIIAHVKDGADLARQHRLPQAIIDFIEQHHGTTLVEYFYRRASEKSEENPDTGEVQENAYRYPGPKPQTIEAAVLMLADSVEGASRTLVEPTPSRIESLVEQIAMNKLLDGQFDECGLTLQQMRQIEDSLIKSLTAVYHGRVKYASTASA
jgi:putative nucleotidyltransferase with HDIG domain